MTLALHRAQVRVSVPNAYKTGLQRALFAFSLALFATLALSSSQAVAQTPIGQATTVTPAATGEFNGLVVTMIDGADLFDGQLITTDTGGMVQILFADGTRMVIGPNSALLIESILMRNANTVQNFTVNALGGTFRFITGNSPSEAYTINTPTGTIAVRGTALDFTVLWTDGFTSIILFDGWIIFCPFENPTVCVVMTQICGVGAFDLTQAGVYEEGDRQIAAQTLFPFVLTEEELEDPNRIGAEACLQPQTDGAPVQILTEN